MFANGTITRCSACASQVRSVSLGVTSRRGLRVASLRRFGLGLVVDWVARVECIATATHWSPNMKSATLPSLRVEPELREAAESVLQEGETLSGFIEASVRETILRRRTRAEFIARGLAARDEAKGTGVYIDADVVHDRLTEKLAEARTRLLKKARA